MKTKTNFYNIFIYCILITGTMMALVQFFFNRSLWWDEASLALSIISRNFWQLLKPLDGGQVAPILFLQFEKLFSLMIPDSEFGLRLFPLICYLISLFLFFKILEKILPDSFSITFALSLFVFNLVLIRYSSEAKQYMTDVLVSTTLFYLLIKDYKSEVEKFKILAIVGVFAIFLSNISPIVLFSAGMFLVFKFLTKEIHSFKGLFIVFCIWAFFFVVYYLIFIHHHPAKNFMLKYWSGKGAFLPINPFEPGFIEFFKMKHKEVFNQLLFVGKYGQTVLPLFFFTGLFAMIKARKTGILILTMSPVMIHLVLSALHFYPFANRLILYLIPMIVIAIGYGLAYLFNFVFVKINLGKARLLVVFIPLLFLSVFWKKDFPVKVAEIKENIEFLRNNKKPDEALFVSFSMANAFKYYQETGFCHFTNVQFGNNSWTFGDGYVDSLKRAKSGLWLLTGQQSNKNESKIINELDSAGATYSRKFASKGTTLYFVEFEKLPTK